MMPLKVWLQKLEAATINHLHVPIIALMFGCSGTQIYHPDLCHFFFIFQDEMKKIMNFQDMHEISGNSRTNHFSRNSKTHGRPVVLTFIRCDQNF